MQTTYFTFGAGSWQLKNYLKLEFTKNPEEFRSCGGKIIDEFKAETFQGSFES